VIARMFIGLVSRFSLHAIALVRGEIAGAGLG
jgi:hypothetical protein